MDLSAVTDLETSREFVVENEALFELEDGSEAREFLLAERPRFVRGTLYLAIFMLVAAFAWSCVARFDVVATAPGVVRPRGALVQVQAQMSGGVSEVLVHEGQQVVARQVLLRLDARPMLLEKELAAARLDAKRREKRDATENLDLVERSHEAERASRQGDISNATIQVEVAKAARDLALRRARARLEYVRARVAATKLLVTEEERRSRDMDALVRQNLEKVSAQKEANARLETARADANTELKSLAQAEVDAEPDDNQVRIADGALRAKQSLLAELDANYALRRSEATSRITRVEAEIVELEDQLNAVELKLEKVEVRAPVAGLVSRLAETQVTHLVTSGSTVAEIAPAGRQLVLESYVSDTDRGDMKLGRKAKVRFAAYPSQEYGALEGDLVEIAPDASRPPADAPVTVAPNVPVYKVIVALPASEIVDHRGKVGHIELGMTAQADIVLDESPVIFLIWSELKAFFDWRKR